jgi:hypothetical protein
MYKLSLAWKSRDNFFLILKTKNIARTSKIVESTFKK